MVVHEHCPCCTLPRNTLHSEISYVLQTLLLLNNLYQLSETSKVIVPEYNFSESIVTSPYINFFINYFWKFINLDN